MNDKPALMQFTSHINGRNSDVLIYPDRVELAGRKVLWQKGGTEMIPISQITSVAVKRDGFRWAVTIITSGATIDMRVSKDEAEQIKDMLQRLILA